MRSLTSAAKRLDNRTSKPGCALRGPGVLGCVVALALAGGAWCGTADQVDAVRALLQAPPRLEYYLYKNTPSDASPTKGLPPGSVLIYYRGRWDSESAHWAGGLATTNDPPSAVFGSFEGRLGTIVWQARAGDLTLYNLGQSPADPVRLLDHGARQNTLLLLRLGLFEVDFPNAVWSGSGFRAPTDADARGRRQGGVEGFIRELATGSIEISVTNAVTRRLQQRVILAFPSGAAVSPFPSTIERYDVFNPSAADAVPRKTVTLEVLQANISPAELPVSALDPRLMPELWRRRTFFRSNESLFAVSPFASNRIERVLTAQESAAVHRAANYPRAALAAALVVMLSAALFMRWFANRKKWSNQ